MQEPAASEIGRVYFPSSPGEFITLFAHFHRAEIARMAGWRDRIDRTTNWAITLVAAMLSVSLSTSNAHHSVLMFAMVLAFFLLMIESRRYRFFDVYRSRVRRLERNYYAKLFDPGLEAERDWLRTMAADLQTPTFVMSMAEAVSRRLRRNYIWIFLILLGAWALKVTFPSFSGEIPAALSFQDWVRNAGVGPVSGWIISAIIVGFYGWIVVAAFRTHRHQGELAHGDAHV
ncbi:DUF2270 domain-containing protein [Afipia sp. GAS231]|uniref:DUF2270 domain-containing protein n=1 Tax=Afipia sp. GAS231 TaxID=1882747 RepID=UPI00087B8A0E|nr:DUF2270 domain-containing protein [Afipia sp. GAS231]SDP26649.1 Uncharacterized membrane protein [Afipia sp. GAS231]